MIEIECGRCHRKHYPTVLGKTLHCCSTKTGVLRLIGEYRDPDTGRKWFAVASCATVRVIIEQGKHQ